MATPTSPTPSAWDSVPKESSTPPPSRPPAGWDKPAEPQGKQRREPSFKVTSLSDPLGVCFIMEDEVSVAKLLGLRYHSFYTAMSLGCGCLARGLHKLDTEHPAYEAAMSFPGASYTHILVTRISSR